MDYKTINANLNLVGIESISTSELHGFITGGLCTQGANFDISCGPFEEPLENNKALVECLSEVISNTMDRLDHHNEVPDLLLPNDEEPLALRCRSLSDWCQGFLFALGASGIPDKQLKDGDAGEILKDIIEISHAYHEELDVDPSTEEDEAILEENERAYAEVVEYLRAGIMVFNENLRPIIQDEPQDESQDESQDD